MGLGASGLEVVAGNTRVGTGLGELVAGLHGPFGQFFGEFGDL